MKTEIITLLRERGTYVSGQELCEHFGVSRTAVWKAIEQLKQGGYAIEAVRNRGYLLREEQSIPAYGRTELESRIRTDWAGRKLRYLETVDSTNLEAKRLAEEGAVHGTVVVADTQTAGRGRRGRNWTSPAGSNLYFTLLLRPQIAPDQASMLTLVMALAVAEGIERIQEEECGEDRTGRMQEETCGEDRTGRIQEEERSKERVGQSAGIAGAVSPKIKWPNDIVIDGRKVCGILTEMNLSVEQGSMEYLVIGAGVNVAKQDFPEEFQGHAAALEEFYGPVSRSLLLAAILQAFETYYEKFIRAGTLSPFKQEYENRLVNRGNRVKVLDPKGEWEGTARGIRETGELLVERADGRVEEIYAGEVSVRGVCGYT